MIKKIFVGVLLAGVFGLLILGAVNRTLAKTNEREPENLNQDLETGGGRNANSQSGNNQNGSNQNQLNNVSDETTLHRGQSENGNATDEEDRIRQGQQSQDSSGNGTGSGLAEVQDWLTDTGVVDSEDASLWTITLSNGTLLEVEGRALSYLAEIGFKVDVGDSVSLTGFYENGDFKLGQIENITTGIRAVVRDENGQPMWSGGRR